jgi:hypothetical protein
MRVRAWAVVLGAVLAVQIVSGADSKPNLVGKWRTVGTEDIDTWTMDFRADGTIDGRGYEGMYFTGKYRIDNSTSPMQFDITELKGTYADNKRSDMMVGIIEFRGADEIRLDGDAVRSDDERHTGNRPNKFSEGAFVLRRMTAVAPVPQSVPPPAPAAVGAPVAAPAAIETARVRGANPFAGRWELAFEFMRNTGNPGEAAYKWQTFDAEFRPDGDLIAGSLKSRNGNPTGTVKGGLTDDGLVGTLRLSWDNHDWQVFTLRFINGTDSGEGIAIFAPRPDTDAERHVYLIKFRRMR